MSINIFMIDETPSIILSQDGKTTFNKLVLKHPFNLRNLNTYNSNEEIVQYGHFRDYLSNFSYELQRSKYVHPSELKKYISYHYENSKDKTEFIDVLRYSVLNFSFIKESQRITDVILDWLKVNENSIGTNVNSQKEKIKWLGSPEQFGFIFGELVSKGFIELPTQETEGSFSKLADLCLCYFELLSTKGINKGKPTTKENLERAINPETNTLSLKGKKTLKLPPLKDLQ